MKSIYPILLLFFLAFVCVDVQAQRKTVIYDDAKNWFGEGESLPAESLWMIRGTAPEGITWVEFSLYTDDATKHLDYRNAGPVDPSSRQYIIPMNHPLKQGESYSISVGYFAPMDTTKKSKLSQDLFVVLNNYLETSLDTEKKKWQWDSHPNAIMSDLNDIVNDAFSSYRYNSIRGFAGFSDLVSKQLEKLDGAKIRQADSSNFAHNGLDAQWTRLIDQVWVESNTAIKNLQHALVNERFISNYPVEKQFKPISLDAGYAGIYQSGNLESLSYDGSPFVGFSIPLGRRVTNPVWSNTSISAGVMLNNLTNEFGNEVSGPLVGRPIYAGVSYKMLRFVRIHAGAAVLQQSGSDTSSLQLEKIYARPYIGLGIEIQFWAGIAKY